MHKKKLFLMSLLFALSLGGLSGCSNAEANNQSVVSGEKGNDGTSLLTGEGAPIETLGNNGDSYINISNFDYYVKEDDKWVLKGNIKGEQGNPGEKGDQGELGEKGDKGDNGDPGSSIKSGSGAPEDTLGKDGDSYLDTSTFDLYFKENGTWSKVGNIKGADAVNYVPVIFLDGDDSLLYMEYVEQGKDASFPSDKVKPTKVINTAYGDSINLDWNENWDQSLTSIQKPTTFKPIFTMPNFKVDSTKWSESLSGINNFHSKSKYSKEYLFNDEGVSRDYYLSENSIFSSYGDEDEQFGAYEKTANEDEVNYYAYNLFENKVWEKHVVELNFDNFLASFEMLTLIEALKNSCEDFSFDEDRYGYYSSSLDVTINSFYGGTTNLTLSDVLIRFKDGVISDIYFCSNSYFSHIYEFGEFNLQDHLPSENEYHTHTFDNTSWVSDSKYHWHPFTCGCSISEGMYLFYLNMSYGSIYSDSGVAEHDYSGEDDKHCKDCGYERELTQSEVFDEAFNNGITSYKHTIEEDGSIRKEFYYKDKYVKFVDHTDDGYITYYGVLNDSSYTVYKEVKEEDGSVKYIEDNSITIPEFDSYSIFNSPESFNQNGTSAECKYYVSSSFDEYYSVEITINKADNSLNSIVYYDGSNMHYILDCFNETELTLPSGFPES